jgi:hypothetical protein
METQIFHHAKILSSKNPLKETKNPSRYIITLCITNLKFQHKSKYHLSRILIKIDVLPRVQTPLTDYTLNESKNNILGQQTNSTSNKCARTLSLNMRNILSKMQRMML